MILLNSAQQIERALRAFVRDEVGLRKAQAAAILLFQSKRPGWRRAQRLYFRAQQLLNMLRNRSIAWVVRPD